MKPSPPERGMPERCIEIILKNKIRSIPSIAGEGELLLFFFSSDGCHFSKKKNDLIFGKQIASLHSQLGERGLPFSFPV